MEGHDRGRERRYSIQKSLYEICFFLEFALAILVISFVVIEFFSEAVLFIRNIPEATLGGLDYSVHLKRALDIVIGTAGTLLGCLLAARVKKDWLVPVPVILANAVLVGAMLAYVLTPDALVQGFFINGGEVLLGEAVVLYLLGVPLLLFFRRSGLMEKLLHGAHPSPH